MGGGFDEPTCNGTPGEQPMPACLTSQYLQQNPVEAHTGLPTCIEGTNQPQKTNNTSSDDNDSSQSSGPDTSGCILRAAAEGQGGSGGNPQGLPICEDHPDEYSKVKRCESPEECENFAQTASDTLSDLNGFRRKSRRDSSDDGSEASLDQGCDNCTDIGTEGSVTTTTDQYGNSAYNDARRVKPRSVRFGSTT